MNRRPAGAQGDFATLVELLRHRATAQPEKLAYRFLKEDKGEEVVWDYAELDRHARGIAAQLEALSMAGERVLLLYPPSLDYLAAFFGCLYAGAIAVPAYPPRPNKPMPRIQAIAADCQAKVVLTTSSILADAQRRSEQAPDLAALNWLSTDDLPFEWADRWQEVSIEPRTLAFLQYTSGSTGNPKGVMVSHANLLHNLEIIRQGFHIDPEGMGITWLPMYHDMGLIGGILEPMYVGGPATLLSPVTFLQRPASWLQAITRYRGTISGAPNFAYDLCVEKVTDEQRQELDLGSWDLAFSGAEPIRPATLDRFARAFESCGFRRSSFYPCFGLAEGTLMVSGGLGSAEPTVHTIDRAALEQNHVVASRPAEANSLSMVGCGHALGGQRIAIVHPETRVECPAEEVGEIWAQGPSMAQGYWNRPDETRHTFDARLASSLSSAGDAGPFMRTGDLGFIHDGQLYVTGRLKDLIIIRGRNHYPQDIEHTVERSHPALRADAGAAFAIDVAGEERLVIVQEIEREHRRPNVAEIVAAIRRAVAAGHDVQVHAIALVKTLTIPKTSSGKIKRRECRTDYLAGNLNAIGQWSSDAPPATSALQPPRPPSSLAAEGQGVRTGASQMLSSSSTALASTLSPSADTIAAWLTTQISQRLNTPESQIDAATPFEHFGLDSLAAVTLSGDLERWLGRTLSPTLVYDFSTIEALARHLAADATSQLKAKPVRSAHDEPIAIVGLGCRFPGGASDPESYWRLLHDGVDGVTEVPRDRWNVDDFYDPDPHAPGKMSTRWGGFIRDVDKFDTQFFGIAPREAVSMDPQQRLFLEVSWEALEHAGQRPDKLAGSQTGVFMGICSSDYAHLIHATGDRNRIDAYFGTGSAFSVASGRLSYILGLHGPNFPVDTACSSSLVAVHLAMQSLRAGECRLALAGGVNLLLAPESMIYFSKVQAMAADGRCKTFDAAADGYVRGEGCGVVVLKRLCDAVSDGDRVLAVIRGSAVNHDGKSNGLTAPNGSAQEVVIRQALAAADVRPSDVQYVEAHGTGTSLGDPIEVRALGAVLAEGRDAGRPAVMGSVKTNIGHLEAAAGVAGLIKVVLSLLHEEIPPHLHFRSINPHIPLAQLPLVIPIEARPWKRGQGRRIAGLSSFGFSGTNAHLIVEEAPEAVAPTINDAERPLHVVTLSAKTRPALEAAIQRLRQHVDAHPQQALADVAFTLNSGRAQFAERVAVVAATSQELAAKLPPLLLSQAEGRGEGARRGRTARPKIALLFTGQGAQQVGMGRELYQTQPTFRRALDECAEILQGVLEQPLLSVLYPAEGQPPEGGTTNGSLLNETAYTQPALFAFEYALAQLWRSWGVEPAVVLGHSVGEYVAACVAGVFTLEEGLPLIAERARLMQALPSGGQMAAVFAAPAVVEAAIEPYADRVSIAAYNGPENVVISGSGEAVGAILAKLDSDGIRAARLTVSHAFHSPSMEPMLDEFERRAAQVTFQAPRLRLISNLTGQPAEKDLLTQASYWRRHIRQPVRFEDSIRAAAEQGCELLLEIGPGSTLLGLARRCLPAGSPQQYLPSLRPGKTDWQQMLDSLSALYAAGVELDWRGFDRDYHRQRLWLPTYPFQRERYWLETIDSNKPPKLAARRASSSDHEHPLLGARLRTALKDTLFEAELSTAALPYLADHVVYGQPLLPATAYLEMALSAAAAALSSQDVALEAVQIQEPLFLSSEPQTVQVVVSPAAAAGQATFQIVSLSGEGPDGAAVWTQHAVGQVVVRSGQSDERSPDLSSEESSEAGEPISKSAYYQRLHEQGLEYGALFQAIDQLQRRDGEAWGELSLAESLAGERNRYRLHPALLDACFQLLGAALPSGSLDRLAYVPVGLERYQVFSASAIGPQLRVQATTRGVVAANPALFTGDVRLYDAQSRQLVAEVTGLTLAKAPRELLLRSLKPSASSQDWLYELSWQPSASTTSRPALPGLWLIVSDEPTLGTRLIDELRERDQSCRLVGPQELASLPSDGAAPRGVVYLCSAESPDDPLSATNAMCAGLLQVVQSLASRPHPSGQGGSPRLWIVTRGGQPVQEGEPTSPAASAVWGLARVAALEHPELRPVRIDLQPSESPVLEALCQELLSPDREDQIAYRGGQRYVARLVRSRSAKGSGVFFAGNDLDRDQPQDGRKRLPTPLRLEIPRRGVLDNLELAPMTRRAPGRGEVEIEVRATGLNFRDVLNVLGLYPGDPGPLGGECAGTIAAVGEGVAGYQIGDTVLGIASGSFSTYVTTPACLIAQKPPSLSFEEAATIPITFLTAHYALNHLAKLQAGDRVLIQAAAGGVGLAAVQLAQRAGAEIFGTAGSPAKRQYLVEQGLAADHLLNSRTVEFAEQIQTLTGGQGVRVVLNSLAGEFIAKGLSLVSPGGHFLEIGKADLWDRARVTAVNARAQYTAIALDQMVVERPEFVGQMLAELMELFGRGELQPLCHRDFTIGEAASAFRFMAQAKHIGKVVVTQAEAGSGQRAADGRQTGEGASEVKVTIRSDAAYLITGGLGALGLVSAQWLASQGAKHLVLVGRSAPGSEAQAVLAELKQQGVSVLVAAADLSKPEDVARLLAEAAAKLPPLRGVIHAAGVLDDGVLSKQDWPRFEKVLAPKAAGGWHLHQQTRELPLDFFVMYSSMASLLGSPGQGNYAAANAFLDGLAWQRRAQGLAATSINWGPWAEAGMAATRNPADQRRWQAQGLSPIPTATGLKYLDQCLRTATTQVAVLPLDWLQWRKTYPRFAELPLFSQVIEKGAAQAETHLEREAILAAPPAERGHKVAEYLRAQVARILQISEDKLDLHQPLKTVGLDSLMAIELKNLVEANLAVEIPAAKLLEGPTLAQLAAQLTPQLGGEVAAATAAQPYANEEASAPRQGASWIAYHAPRPEARVRLLCFHYLGGGASAFRQWSELLPPEIDVLPVQLPGREGRIQEPPSEDLASLAADLAADLLPWLDRPFAIYGHSMGALIGFELAQQLRRRHGLQPVQFFIGAYFAPHTPNPFHARREWHEADAMQAVQRLLDVPQAVLANAEFMQVLLPTMQADSRLVGSYLWRDDAPLDCPITAFGGLEDREVGPHDLKQWQRHTAGEFRLEMLPGGHLFLLSERERLVKMVWQHLEAVAANELTA